MIIALALIAAASIAALVGSCLKPVDYAGTQASCRIERKVVTSICVRF